MVGRKTASRTKAPKRKTAIPKTKSSPKAPKKGKPTSPRRSKTARAGASEGIRRLKRELAEALERQEATSEILAAISRSSSDLQSVLDTLVQSAARLSGASYCFIFRRDGKEYRLASSYGFAPAYRDWMAQQAIVPGRHTLVGKTALTEGVVHIPDVLADTDYAWGDSIKRGGFRAMLGIPLMREGIPIGTIAACRPVPEPFTEKQIELISAFADQAVIAIENARLFNETREALERQTATADILKVIAGSPSSVQPVFDAILARALHLCEAVFGFLTTYDGERFAFAAQLGVPPALHQHFRAGMEQPQPGDAHWRLLEGEDLVHNLDQKDEEAYRAGNPLRRAVVDLGGARSALVVALRKDGSLRGSITIYRQDVRSFSTLQIALLQHFADQAVIAIENVRLFEQVQAKTLDLSEALTYQTGSANILRVIASSPTDVNPVLQAIAESACELCEAYDAIVRLRIGDTLHAGAHHGQIPITTEEWPINRNSLSGRVVLQGSPIHVRDMQSAEADEFPESQERARRLGHRTILSVPLIREGHGVGVIILRRTEVRPFTEKQIALLQTFADQAAIAIGNVRLFEEVQAKTRDLSESLQQQTATADVLKVISRSAFDLDGVMNALVRSAAELCSASTSSLSIREGDLLVVRGVNAPDATVAEFVRRNPIPINDQTLGGRAILTGSVVNVDDTEIDQANPLAQKFREVIGHRALLLVPLMRDGRGIGVFSLTRKRPGRFSQREIELVQSFADQAVIAIENTRLFNETQEALERQTATADILKVIASSPDDVQPVFEAIAERSNRIVDGRSTAVYSLVDGILHLMAFTPTSPEADATLRAFFPRPLSQVRWGEAIGRGEIHQVSDMQESATPIDGRKLAERRGFRALMVVPLVSDERPIGVISVTRATPGKFSDHHVQLLQTFADQAVIAISNVGLFQEVQQRTRDLSRSLDELRAAQDRLIQTEKLASLGQLTAGIAHEIKNPLNFVNNFSGMSAELVGELQEVVTDLSIDPVALADIKELTGMLSANLEKIVQHGKRADAIVKSMLLHSGQSSGEHRLCDVNALVDESLNRAYYGERAETRGFAIKLERSFDPNVGEVDLFPREISRALVNLISNGFYSAIKRKESQGGDYEPVLAALTRNLGDRVEVRIRDNGGGIPAEVKEKMFDPFFTTKPAGEGTGLGLSITHDIVVKQHGGSIEVDSKPGEYTEVRLILPRAGALSVGARA